MKDRSAALMAFERALEIKPDYEKALYQTEIMTNGNTQYAHSIFRQFQNTQNDESTNDAKPTFF